MASRVALRWSPASRRDLRDIWKYYANVASVEIADRLLRDLEAAARQLSERPRLWRPRDDLRPGLRAVLIRPYCLFYLARDSEIEIVRILHERRDIKAVLRKS